MHRIYPGQSTRFQIIQAKQDSYTPQTVLLADSGHVGMAPYHTNTHLPHKNTKKHKLTKRQKQDSRQISSERLGIEHVFSSKHLSKIML